jgi:acetyl-CoA carboxylase biotin carboxyl carrier protein
MGYGKLALNQTVAREWCMNVNDIKKLVTIIQESDLSEFHYESEGTVIKIMRKPEASTVIPAPSIPYQYLGSYQHLGALSYGAGVMHQPTSNQVGEMGQVAYANPAAKGEAVHQSATAPDTVSAAEADNLFKVECPVVGTFYRKPSPDANVFVNEGDRVKKGDTLCIVEAMKVMNEVDAPCDGVVAKVCVSDGAVVEYGEALFLIKP